VHPTLLAGPESESILHAAGIVKKDPRPRSIQTRTVVDRLKYVDPNFGEDRATDALFLADLRNGELHTADATLKNAPEAIWLPKLLAVVEAVCDHLEMPVEDFLSDDITEHAKALRLQADKAILHSVQVAIKNSKYLFDNLTPGEITQREASVGPLWSRGSGQHRRKEACPACGKVTVVVEVAPGRATKSFYDEDTDEITWSVVYLSQSASCGVCGLSLGTTAEVMAAGFPRLYPETFTEDRYEGWEQRVEYGDEEEPDYGND
jgi:hypothetical protein